MNDDERYDGNRARDKLERIERIQALHEDRIDRLFKARKEDEAMIERCLQRFEAKLDEVREAITGDDGLRPRMAVVEETAERAEKAAEGLSARIWHAFITGIIAVSVAVGKILWDTTRPPSH